MTDTQTALDTIAANYPARKKYCDYYDGVHYLAFATEKFKTAFGKTLAGMRDNLCPIVVEAPADRMEIINFAGEEGNIKAPIATESWKIWQREQMELESFNVHLEAVKTGASYVIVWPNEKGETRFFLQDSRNCVVIEDEETGEPLFGAKQWKTDDDKVRLNLYYADRIEKRITAKSRTGQTGALKAEHFIKFADKEPTENPYGVVPMFEFKTMPVLEDAIPVQDVLNKTLADRMVSQEFAAFRQRWATGLTPPADELTGVPTLPFKAGADRLWFTDAEGVKFGEFDATALEPFLQASDADRLEMARISGTPLHFFSINVSDAISGKALKALESRFTKKVKRLTLNFGAVWAQIMKLALQIEKKSVDGTLTVQWSAVETQDEKELWETLGLKADLGIPEEILWEESGYTKEDIARFKKLQELEPEPTMVNVQGQKVDKNGVPVNEKEQKRMAAQASDN